jgi:exodeoxyribonuclease-3
MGKHAPTRSGRAKAKAGFSLRLASWNVNSIRLRLSGLKRLVERETPDVLCLQEIKVRREDFPFQAFAALGYPFIALAAQAGYHGVAIVSRLALIGEFRLDWFDDEDARHIAAEFANGIELHNFYVPAGGDVPDPATNAKFAHKLEFLAEMHRWFESRRKRRGKLILAGDLNVAPLATDVWSHRQLLNVVSHTPVEVEALARIQHTLGFVDAVRHFVPEDVRLYSWWSYRARDWRTSDRGRRLDHIWITPDLLESLRGASVLKASRGWKDPSDHVPVIVTLHRKVL